MQYRQCKATGNKLSALGLGCMRFPRDKAETERMLLKAIDGGLNYFDTAYIYPGSESTLGEILAKNNKRKDIFLATKLPLMLCKKSEDFDKFFSEHFKRLQTDYIDYYLLHNISSLTQWESLKKLGIEEWIAEKKKTGQIRHIGFSYHGTYDDFVKILDSYVWEFCMIQYNYYDENYQAGKKGLKAAAEKGLSVMIMEPLLGGRLATGLPGKAEKVFANADPDITPAERAFRWLWNQDEVTVVLSGMSSVSQIEENISYINSFKPLSDEESALYTEVVDIFKESYKIPCTGCGYCLPCPKGINIPGCFSALNARYSHGFMAAISLYANTTAFITKHPHIPRSCTGCGKCEKHCPQNIPIRKDLKKVTKTLEPLPVRMAIALVRLIMAR